MKKILFFPTILLFGLMACSTPEPPETPISVTGVTLTPTTLRLTVGENATLTATITPRNAHNQQKTWESSDRNIASVTNGQVTANAPGTATITVRTADRNFTDNTKITIIPYISNSLDGVVINGIRWATRNVDMPGTFAESPESLGMFFQWNRRIGWSSTNPMVNSDGGTTWDSSMPTGTEWYAKNDPCPEGWRVPTRDELESLRGYECIELSFLNSQFGRFFGTAPNQIFLPAIGFRHQGGGALDRWVEAYYWSSTRTVANDVSAFWIRSGSISGSVSRNRGMGYNVRCVAKQN